jgi:hypothetical protein
MYQGQWRKRLTYYKKCAYKIERWEHGAESGSVVKTKKVAEPEGGCLILD